MSIDVIDLPLGRVVEPRLVVRPSSVLLQGRYIDIVPFDVSRHARELYERSHGPDREALWAYLGAGPFEDFAAFEAHYTAAAAKDDPLLLAIIDKASGVAVGHATYMRIDTPNRVIEVGNILYTRALMRTPGGTEAMALMARHAFELGYRRYEWKCNALNAPSRRAAERYGFRFEGLFRQHMIIKGRNRDTAWFSILDTEWPQRGYAMECWLSADNFDPAGGQRIPLGIFNADRLQVGDSVLRRASLDDLDAVLDLQRRAYAKNRILLGVEPVPMLWDYARVFREREVWVVDRDGGEPASGLAAVLILQPRADDLLVDSVAISPMAQGSGLGNVLLAAGDERARQLGRHRLRLYTGEPLSANIQWYRRKGYSIERVEQMPDRRLVHMTKTLD